MLDINYPMKTLSNTICSLLLSLPCYCHFCLKCLHSWGCIFYKIWLLNLERISCCIWVVFVLLLLNIYMHLVLIVCSITGGLPDVWYVGVCVCVCANWYHLLQGKCCSCHMFIRLCSIRTFLWTQLWLQDIRHIPNAGISSFLLFSIRLDTSGRKFQVSYFQYHWGVDKRKTLISILYIYAYNF